jgi:hypothetical protein
VRLKTIVNAKESDLTPRTSERIREEVHRVTEGEISYRRYQTKVKELKLEAPKTSEM